MDWFVQFHQAGADHLIRVKTPEEAIELACRLLDDGRDVWAIGTGSLTDTIAKDQIARIYQIWLRAKPHTRWRGVEIQTSQNSSQIDPPRP